MVRGQRKPGLAREIPGVSLPVGAWKQRQRLWWFCRTLPPACSWPRVVSAESPRGEDRAAVRRWVGISLGGCRQGAHSIPRLAFPDPKPGGGASCHPVLSPRWAGGAVGSVVLQRGRMGGNSPLLPSLGEPILYLTRISAPSEELLKGRPAQDSLVGPSRAAGLDHGCPQPWLHPLQPRAAPSHCPWTWMPTSAPCSTAAPPAPCRGTRPATRQPRAPSPASPPPPTSGTTRTSSRSCRYRAGKQRWHG